MAKIKLEEQAESLYPTLPVDAIIQVETINVEVKPARSNTTGESWEKLEFTFTITGVPSALGDGVQTLVGSKIWGSTSLRFSTHPDNKLRQWAEALLGMTLDPGFELDTDMLVNRRARALISNYTKKNGQPAHQVAALLPLVEQTVSVGAAESSFDDDPPF